MKKAKIEDYIFLSIIILIMAGGVIKPIIKPRKINAVENRNAYLLPNFTISTFLTGEYQDGYEKALSDQIPLSNTLKKVETNKNILLKTVFYNCLNDKDYHLLGSTVYLYQDYLVYNKNYTSKTDKKINEKSIAFNKAKAKIKDTEMYIYYIESDKDINFKSNNKFMAYEKLIKNLNSTIKTDRFAIDNFEDYKQYYYRTDHHWNYKGSYKGYKEIINLISDDKPETYKKKICLDTNFLGSQALSIGGSIIFTEDFCYYDYNHSKKDIYVHNKKVSKYGEQKKYINKSPSELKYGTIYGWDKGLIEFNTNNKEKENIVVIGESFDNPIIELISEHFNKTYSVDLRHYERYMKEEFNLTDFVLENDIDKVLFIGKIDFFITEEHDFKY